MRIFITGASGFIGKTACEYFEEKNDIFAPAHSELELLDADAVQNYVEKNDIDVILHCANRGGRREDFKVDKVLEDNLRIFFNITRTSASVKRIIYYGSGAEFGKSRNLKKVKEEQFGEQIPKEEYGFYKYVCNSYAKNSENVINLRLFGVFGRYENYRYRFISNAIMKNLAGADITVNRNVIFDFLYITDLITITDHFINKDSRYKEYNVTPTNSIDLLRICDIINRIARKRSVVKVLNEGFDFEYTGDNSRLMEELGNFKFKSYDESIADLYKYYEQNMDKIDVKKLTEPSHTENSRSKK